jgi:transposase
MDSSDDLIGINGAKVVVAKPMEEPIMANDTLVAVDLAKVEFDFVVSTRVGKVDYGRRLKRAAFLEFIAQHPQAIVILEACGSAHELGRKLQKLGHKVVLLPPHAVRPYVMRNKTDRADARALLEAYRNQDIHPVPVKTVEQQTLTSMHRLRSGWIAERTAKINTIRGLLREFGLFIPLGANKVLAHAHEYIADPASALPAPLRPLLTQLCDEIRTLDEYVDGVSRQIEALGRQTPVVVRLMTIPGIAFIVATALVAFVGNIHRFPTARHFASYLGLTPKEFSSGSKRRLGSISKKGDVYLRMLLIHGARSVLMHAHKAKHPDRLQSWALQLERKVGPNKAAVALANKIARIAWAVWRHDRDFESKPVAA